MFKAGSPGLGVEQAGCMFYFNTVLAIVTVENKISRVSITGLLSSQSTPRTASVPNRSRKGAQKKHRQTVFIHHSKTQLELVLEDIVRSPAVDSRLYTGT